MKKMTRRESILTMAPALAAVGTSLRAAAQPASGTAQTQSPGPAAAQGAGAASQTAQTSSSDQTFEKFVDEYFDGFFRFDPASATSAGIHKYDAELPSYSQAEIQGEIARSQTALRDLARIPTDGLSEANLLDATVLESLISGHLLDLADIRMWSKDPGFITLKRATRYTRWSSAISRRSMTG
jgi:hypothetical protein